jgi:hypothetical protein
VFTDFATPSKNLSSERTPIIKVASFIVQDPRYVGIEISQQLAKSSENLVAFQTTFVVVAKDVLLATTRAKLYLYG